MAIENRSVLVVNVDSPSVIYIRVPTQEDRDFLAEMEKYCLENFNSTMQRSFSLNDRKLCVGLKYFVLEENSRDSLWRRAALISVLTVGKGHRAGMFLIDEARYIDVPVEHLLPMPQQFADHPAMVRRVIISGIRPCSLVTDSFTWKTGFRPADVWDLAAVQYAKKLFFSNPSLADVKLRNFFIDENRVCFGDLEYRDDNEVVPSYAQHLIYLKYASSDPEDRFNHDQLRKEPSLVEWHDNLEGNTKVKKKPIGPQISSVVYLSEPATRRPPFSSSRSLTVFDESGALVLRCHKPELRVTRDKVISTYASTQSVPMEQALKRICDDPEIPPLESISPMQQENWAYRRHHYGCDENNNLEIGRRIL